MDGPDPQLDDESAYRALFEAAPDPYLILDARTADFRVVAVNRAYLSATLTERTAVVGRPLLAVLGLIPGDPRGPAAELEASLARVLADGRPDAMAVQRRDVRHRDGSGEERFWSSLNTPVLGADGQPQLIIHRVEDVTAVASRQASLARGRQLDAAARADALAEQWEAPEADHGRGQVLIVDADAEVAAYTRDVLAGRFRVRVAASAEAGLRLAGAQAPDLIVAGLGLLDGSDVDLVAAVRGGEDSLARVPIIVLSPDRDRELRSELLAGGASDVLVTPFSPRELRARAMRLVAANRTARALEAATLKLAQLTGSDRGREAGAARS